MITFNFQATIVVAKSKLADNMSSVLATMCCLFIFFQKYKGERPLNFFFKIKYNQTQAHGPGL